MTNYIEQLGDWTKQKKSTPRNKNLVAFLANKNDVEAALQAGYAAKTIWENMCELQRIEFGYDTFLSYINRFIRKNKTEKTSSPLENTPLKNVISTAIPLEKSALGFIFNPLLSKEDLI